jgi:hypothetical protein
MKFFLIFIVGLLFFDNSFSQNVKFTCYLTSSCKKDTIVLEEYELRKGTYHYYSLNSGANASLPDTGLYILSSYKISTEGDSIIVHVGYGLNKFFVRKKDINDVVVLNYDKNAETPSWSGWMCCEKKCEGYKVDYYDSGNKRMEGKFKKGKPVGELKFYNETGKLKYIEYYNRRGRKIRSEYIKT